MRSDEHQRGRIAVLISGRGSNLQALADACTHGKLDADICLVISDRPAAAGLRLAQQAKLPCELIDRARFDDRASFERVLVQMLDAQQPDLIVLAGFMQILSDGLVQHYRGRLVNIHPSLLPRFRGLNTHERVLEAGVQCHGASVHFVIPKLDAGPVVVQAEVPVLPADSVASLAARVLAREHLILPLAAGWLLSGRCRLQQETMIMDGEVQDRPPLVKWNENPDLVDCDRYRPGALRTRPG